ncbi:hypothetical protein D3C85_1589000 [compost metagenome]
MLAAYPAVEGGGSDSWAGDLAGPQEGRPEHADFRRGETERPRALQLHRVHRRDPRVSGGAGVLCADGVGGLSVAHRHPGYRGL